MPGNFKKDDLRIIKTRRALTSALYTLLRRYSFGRITVYDICSEAMVSRSAFYTHFSDKFALLEACLIELRKDLAERFRALSIQELEDNLCEIFLNNIKVCANLLDEAENDLLQILFEYLPPDIYLSKQEKKDSQMTISHKALSNFLAGGLFSLIIWQVKNKPTSKEQIKTSILYTYNMVQAILDWDTTQTVTD